MVYCKHLKSNKHLRKIKFREGARLFDEEDKYDDNTVLPDWLFAKKQTEQKV